MKKTLFLVCPTSRVEHFLRKQYAGAFFLTALAGVFRLDEQYDLEGLSAFIEKEKIEEVCVVNDTDCRFIKNVIAHKKSHGTYAEQVLVDLLIDHYHDVMHSPYASEQCYRLAALNVQRQTAELLDIEYFLQQVVLQKLHVKGLVTCMAENRLSEVDMNDLVLAI